MIQETKQKIKVMDEVKKIIGSANSFHTGYLRGNIIGQPFKGGIVVNVTNKYIETDKDSFSKKGLQINFKETNPNAGGFQNTRRD